MDEHETDEVGGTSLDESFAVIQKGLPEGGYLPMCQHAHVPTPLPITGELSRTLEDAVARAREVLETKRFVRAWAVSRDAVVEVTLMQC